MGKRSDTRVLAARDKFLMCAAHLGESPNNTVHAICDATVEILLVASLGDTAQAAEWLRDLAEVVERGRPMPAVEVMQ
jgi:hypothetical protein